MRAKRLAAVAATVLAGACLAAGAARAQPDISQLQRDSELKNPATADAALAKDDAKAAKKNAMTAEQAATTPKAKAAAGAAAKEATAAADEANAAAKETGR